jgi:hypothetical protein
VKYNPGIPACYELGPWLSPRSAHPIFLPLGQEDALKKSSILLITIGAFPDYKTRDMPVTGRTFFSPRGFSMLEPCKYKPTLPMALA